MVYFGLFAYMFLFFYDPDTDNGLSSPFLDLSRLKFKELDTMAAIFKLWLKNFRL
jgi:hypothetical protein